METNQPAKAIPCYEKAFELGVIDTTSYFNLVITCDQAHDKERTVKWALTALPVFEKRLRLAPDDEVARVWYANLLWYAGQSEKAIEAAKLLAVKKNLDGSTLYNIACLYAKCGEAEDAMKYLERTVEGGFRQIEPFLTDPDLEPLRGRADFAKLLRQLEAAHG
jgi:tetratricopeptide (TPR) repeat protein